MDVTSSHAAFIVPEKKNGHLHLGICTNSHTPLYIMLISRENWRKYERYKNKLFRIKFISLYFDWFIFIPVLFSGVIFMALM